MVDESFEVGERLLLARGLLRELGMEVAVDVLD